MPTYDEILSGLTAIANNWRWLAIAWHAYFGVLAFCLALGARPPKRVAGILLTLPLLSVSVVAWVSANPFNGILLALLGIALIIMASRLSPGRIQPATPRVMIAGAMMFALGWVYPHFLKAPSLLPYLYASPVGTIPCPTLSIVTGLALAVGGLRSRAWSLTLGAIGVFYGLSGATLLGVTLDWILLAGALLLVLAGLTTKGELQTSRMERTRGSAGV